MSDIAIPKTPTPEPVSHYGRALSTPGSKASDNLGTTPNYHSPPPPSSSDLTPPPSSQPSKAFAKSTYLDPNYFGDPSLASPPPTLRTLPIPSVNTASHDFPSLAQVAELSLDQLRALVSNLLLPALNEARMSAAHSKLQHSLLSIETSESAKRAAVEHDMTRREVEVLKASDPLTRGRTPMLGDVRSLQATTQRHLDLAIQRCHELESDNSLLEHRSRQAKKLIKYLDGKVVRLEEDNYLLRQRIKQNRDHLDSMRSSGALSVNGTPRTNYGTPSQKPAGKALDRTRIGTQDSLDALLFAGQQVLNIEANSVPSTPTRSRPTKLHHGHVRGTHSLSSLPTAQNRSRPLTADGAMHTHVIRQTPAPRISSSAPGTQAVATSHDRRREDRDSTISASDREDEALTDNDVPTSQASRVAADMLRRFSGTTAGVSSPASSSQTKPLLQSKLTGKMAKSGLDRSSQQDKRNLEPSRFNENMSPSKKAKLGNSKSARMGLGIQSWPSPVE
ncbi:hypothetical protein MMC20_002003 [Loxospora ochrophaea]|nr:hypothetical protein [Loxospora ochrophaea]